MISLTQINNPRPPEYMEGGGGTLRTLRILVYAGSN